MTGDGQECQEDERVEERGPVGGLRDIEEGIEGVVESITES
jgi:hypothetical protein